MPRQSPALAQTIENPCAIVRSLGVLADTWTFLIVREALLGARTFAQFRDALGIASDVLSARLTSLVEHGVLARTPYREPGQRSRDAYDLTPAGEDLTTVLVAMQQWGHAHVPRGPELPVTPVTDGQHPVRARLVDDRGQDVDAADVRFVRVGRPEGQGRIAAS
jgi:DNA-binding HxlR family transcriptional regulator